MVLKRRLPAQQSFHIAEGRIEIISRGLIDLAGALDDVWHDDALEVLECSEKVRARLGLKNFQSPRTMRQTTKEPAFFKAQDQTVNAGLRMQAHVRDHFTERWSRPGCCSMRTDEVEQLTLATSQHADPRAVRRAP